MRFNIRSPLVVIALATALIGFLSINKYTPGPGLIWNLVHAEIHLTSPCGPWVQYKNSSLQNQQNADLPPGFVLEQPNHTVGTLNSLEFCGLVLPYKWVLGAAIVLATFGFIGLTGNKAVSQLGPTISAKQHDSRPTSYGIKAWIKNVLYVVSVLGVFALAKPLGEYFGKTAVRDFSKGQLEGTIAEGQLLAAQHLQAQLPMKSDEITTLISVAAIGPRLLYSHRIEVPSDKIDADAFKISMKKQLVQKVCTSSMYETLKVGGTYAYAYQANDGTLLAEIPIELSTCVAAGHSKK